MKKQTFKCESINIYKENDEIIEDINFNFYELIKEHENEINSFCKAINIDLEEYILLIENLIYLKSDKKEITLTYRAYPYNDDKPSRLYLNNSKYCTAQQGFFMDLLDKNITINEYKKIFNSKTLLEASKKANMLEKNKIEFFTKIINIIDENLPIL